MQTRIILMAPTLTSVARSIACIALVLSLPSYARAQNKARALAAFQRFELGESQWTTGFWADRQKILEQNSLPQMWQIMTDDSHSQFLTNFLIASGKREGKHRGPAWNDGDFYKWIEAASSILSVKQDAELEQHIDEAITAIGNAQREDGYVHTPVQIRRLQGDVTAIPFSEPLQFELYNLGHLMSAGCMHCRATGKKSLLNIAIAAANFLDRTFSGPEAPLGRSAICPSHYMGLIELGRYNGLLATVSLDGSSYFYTNTLRQLDKMPTELRWSRERKPFISCYCCPPNILRTIAQTQLFAYGKSKQTIWVHLYGSSRLRTTDENGSPIEIVQETEYPSNGHIRIGIAESPEETWSMRLRIGPRWTVLWKSVYGRRPVGSF